MVWCVFGIKWKLRMSAMRCNHKMIVWANISGRNGAMKRTTFFNQDLGKFWLKCYHFYCHSQLKNYLELRKSSHIVGKAKWCVIWWRSYYMNWINLEWVMLIFVILSWFLTPIFSNLNKLQWPIWLEEGAKRLPRGKEFATRQSQIKLKFIMLKYIIFHNRFVLRSIAFDLRMFYVCLLHVVFICLVCKW